MAGKYPPEVRDFIAEHNRGKSAKELTALVNKTFGMSYTSEQIKGYRARHHLISGLTGCFVKGRTPHNKGKHVSYPGMRPTQFKKGHKPQNHRPVGSERVNADGYRERKVAEPNVWRAVHLLAWEAVNGPVPKGHVVIFKDSDRLNCDISNLLLVSRAELARMNQRHLISTDPNLTEVGQNIARLISATTKKKKQRKRRWSK